MHASLWQSVTAVNLKLTGSTLLFPQQTLSVLLHPQICAGVVIDCQPMSAVLVCRTLGSISSIYWM